MARKRKKTPTLREIHGDSRPKVKSKTRCCLKCDKQFESKSIANRLCDHCRDMNLKNMAFNEY